MPMEHCLVMQMCLLLANHLVHCLVHCLPVLGAMLMEGRDEKEKETGEGEEEGKRRSRRWRKERERGRTEEGGSREWGAQV